MAPTLSVVVPFHNVEDYFLQCLESLAAQTFADFEVVMVDDGSPDGSAVIAKAFAARDPRFRLVQQDNQGLGPARNTGVRHTDGRYLAFADSDDIVPPHAYERMIASLEETGSDLVSGAVDRFTAGRRTRARFYGEAFGRTRLRTHVSRDLELLNDRTAWNKVFRRSFWDAHGFAFPAGAYEDAPVTIPAHVRAASVDVISDVVYHYRVRTTADRSITQRRTELGNLRDRLDSVHRVSEFLRAEAPRLKDAYDLTALGNDVMLYIDVVEEADDAYRAELCRLVRDHVRGVNPRLMRRLPALKRLKYRLAYLGRHADLVAVREYERTGLPAGRPERRGLLRRRWYAGHPFRGDPAIPDSIYDITDELRLDAKIDTVAWAGDELELTGHAYVPGLPMTPAARIDVWLEHTLSGRRVKLPVRRVRVPQVTAASGQPAVSYDHSGFAVRVDPAALRGVPKWRGADWKVCVAVRADGVRMSQQVRGCGPAAQWTPYRHLFEGVRVQVVPADGGVVVRFRHPRAVATDVADGCVRGTVRGATGPDDAALLTCRERGTEARVPLEYDDDGTFRFRPPLSDPAGQVHHDVWIVAGGRKIRLAAGDAFREQALGPLALTATRYGNLTLVEGPSQLLITHVEWDGDELVVSGDTGARPARATLQRRRAGDRYTFPMTCDGTRFTLRLPLGAIPSQAGVLPLFTGKWEIHAEDADGAPLDMLAARSCLAALPPDHDVAGFRYRVWPTRGGGDGLHIHAQVARAADEQGRYARRMLEEHHYPAHRRRPVRDLVLFESYFGWQGSCNPREIWEEFRRRGTGHELVWVRGDRHFALPEGTRTVQRFSREYYELTATASIIVNNVAQPPCYRPRPGQLYVQTWHGTPIKKVGFETDWSRVECRDQRHRELAEDVSRWDLLISQNPFSTEVLRRAFRYDGEVLESGYPRTDPAHRPGHEELRAAVRDRLGIPDGKRAILYAPTWRDHLQTDRYGIAEHDLSFDLHTAAEALGPDTVILLRLHHLLNAEIPSDLQDFLIDVTAYPDVTGLYLAADALVTDYSSAMCDFAGLGKPILLFAPDLEEYRTGIRGLTFDLTEKRPGPLLSTSAELIAALSGPFTDHGRLAAFAAEFAPHDDGRAAARVVDRLLR
ncbi:bifunctional glycosyltransferase/CDP-glycerol:glycerophosphate glycerophosphotransferase [Actinomadura macrotermitis]|uniref:Glycosyltransferase 2-like domain-containing protein n=1 Tax=Actinomadura macrotermitis TaxID=2585200 RepID=A0A7K0C227_9ACTN|nr:bifunctional glycosyltransferase family 2 protein/CDP-glycerol:glycerophosphate glycerophosphotransferase [Actinomadura macrotermitis]MQY07507.1 hypothetical protein [Actinomadura macrotermitis]